MATKLSKPVLRYIDTELSDREREFRFGFLARITSEGVYLKPPGRTWRKALFVSWATMVWQGAERRAAELQKERAERRKLRKAGLL